MEENKFKLSHIFAGIIIPIILLVLIFVLAVYVNPGGAFAVLGADNVIAVILTSGFAEMIILGVPLVLGLLWNKWAGGAAGFIMGGMYYLASAGHYNGLFGTMAGYNYYGDISMLFWIVYGVIIGYMAGALCNGSTNFKRMLISGLTASIIISVIKAYLNVTVSLEIGRQMAIDQWVKDPLMAVITGFVPLIALGVIVPILAKVMTWYGLQPQKHAGY
ncbi:MAG: hypothetical protein IAX22_10560 [Candidatus Bathyarchaeota archaeon]|nr:hypothetical protein [Candidatus Bathyarchaeota archaeon]